MVGCEHGVPLAVEQSGFFLCLRTPQQEDFGIACVHLLNQGISQDFPASVEVAACLSCFNCQTGIEQHHPLCCPVCQRAMTGRGQTQITLKFFEDVAQTRRWSDPVRHRKRQPLSLIWAMVRVLSQDHDPYRFRRCQR